MIQNESSVVTLKVVSDAAMKAASVKEVLEEAASMGLEQVIVIGWHDKSISVRGSIGCDRIKEIGALETAKMHLWERS